MIKIDGVALRDKLLEEYKKRIEQDKLTLRLDIITVGVDPASKVYVKNKVKYATYCGIKVVTHELDEKIEESELIELIKKLNDDDEVTGIILQSPISSQLDFDKCAGNIVYYKDVDGFTKENTYRLYHKKDGLVPCTVKGIIKIFDSYGIDLVGKNVTIIGRGNIVGKPLALALENKDATVTLCHSKTKNLKVHTKDADIVISAVGKRNVVTKDMVKEGFIGIDVGINRVDGKLYGDFDYDPLAKMASYITPVPGGVGPMTVAMIIENLILAKDIGETNG